MKEKLIQLSVSKKRIALAVVLAAITVFMGISCYTGIKFIAGMLCIYAAGGLFNVRLSGRFSWLVWPLAAAAMAAFSLALVQMANNCSIILPKQQMLLGIYVALAFMLSFFCVYVWGIKDISGSAKAAIITASLFFLLLGVVNFYVFDLRGKGISPQDFFSIRTAANVAGEYEISMTPAIRNTVALMMAAVLFLTGLKTEKRKIKIPYRLISVACLVVMIFHLRFALDSFVVWHEANYGAQINGLILNLTAQLNQSIKTPPESYGNGWLEDAESEYAVLSAEAGEDAPHIIVIMNECWSDMRVWGEIETDIPVMPFYDSLSDNTVKGHALSSVLGGMTVNSEYEFLSGNSMAFLSPSSVPFTQYINRDVYSIERWLESLGYSSYFTHPAAPINYDRSESYPYLGFDEQSFAELYEGSETFRGFYSDRAVYQKLIERFEKEKENGRQFMLAVTMQNHGPFFKESDLPESISVLNYDSAEFDQYLSCMHETDRALQELVEYFEAQDEKVIILMFGDHQPSMGMELGDAESGYAGSMTQYVVPFVIWANYDVEEQFVELTSLNFLSNYLLEAAGIPLSPYNRFLKDVQQVIPVMNAYGYWSNSKGGFAAYDEAQGEEKEWLEAYEILQYNAMFDKKNRSEAFFLIK